MTTTTTGGRTRRRMAALAVAGVAAATLLAGQLAGSSAQADSSSDTTLTVTADTQMTTFNPFLSYYDGELNVIGAIYPALTQLDDQGEPVPYLADSWTTSADKLTWTFKIHPGLKWSDGQPLTAKDAAWTFNLIMHDADSRHLERVAGGELQVRHRAGRHDARHHHQAAPGQHALPEHPGLRHRDRSRARLEETTSPA